jgi:tetratricopeptide (TPR) repeat protein
MSRPPSGKPDDPDWRDQYEGLLADLRLLGETPQRLIELALHLLDWGNETIELAECERFLRRALALEPDHPEACLELGFFLDAVRDEPAQALPWFERAARGIDTATVLWGYARCLAQVGRREEALRLIDASPHREDDEVAKVRAEIADGDWDHGT